MLSLAKTKKQKAGSPSCHAEKWFNGLIVTWIASFFYIITNTYLIAVMTPPQEGIHGYGTIFF
jgi:hypothetical protein